MTREASLNSKNNNELKDRGVKVVAADLRGPEDDLVSLLKGADVVISTIVATALLDQIPLANAAKKAGVGRFIPCTFATACPPAGVMGLRDMVSRCCPAPFPPPERTVANEVRRKRKSSTTSRRSISRIRSSTWAGGIRSAHQGSLPGVPTPASWRP